MRYVRGQCVSWHDLTFGVRYGVVTEDSGDRTTRVRASDTGNEECVPTGWLAATGERAVLPSIVRPCPACLVEATGDDLFPFERPQHTCVLRGAAA